MGLKGIFENIAARGLKDVTNPEVIRAYLEWSEIKKNGIHLDAEDIIAFSEQIVYRLAKCPECVAAGKCTHCKCPIVEKISTPLAVCSADRWPRIMPAAEWNEYKIENKVQLIALGE